MILMFGMCYQNVCLRWDTCSTEKSASFINKEGIVKEKMSGRLKILITVT